MCEPKQILDARGLLCPMPVIRVQDKVATLPVGALVEVVCTDPGAANDIPAWCRINGHEVVDVAMQPNELRIVIRVVGDV